jgi:hypothetical protein
MLGDSVGTKVLPSLRDLQGGRLRFNARTKVLGYCLPSLPGLVKNR